jgi:ppGpp synthetase/RelA/SpoT-type nucleotidyltranferase/protein-tyrosine phosphatase
MSKLTTWARGVLADEIADRELDAARNKVRSAIEDDELDGDADTLEDEAKRVQREHAKSAEAFLRRLRELFPDAKVGVRLKTLHSMLEKLPRRADKYDEPEKLEDVTGASVVVDTLEDVDAAARVLHDEFDVVDDDDMFDAPNEIGYRARHVTVIDDDGLAKEVQLRTKHADAFAQWQHAVYKPTSSEQRRAIEENYDSIAKFARAASEYLHALDLGISAPRPVAPLEVVQAVGLPWPTSEETQAQIRVARRQRLPQRERESHPMPFDAAQVAECLWVGSAPPKGVEIGRYFDAIVLAAVEYQPPDEKFPGVEVYHAPMYDDPVSLRDALIARDAAQWVNEQRALGKRVFVTCLRGMNRSAIVAAMAMRLGPEHLTMQQAIDRLRKVRGGGALTREGAADAIALAR